MRYAFLAAMLIVPRLRHALPPNQRRQTICVVQIVALIVAMAPVVPPLAATLLATVALALLVWSFAVDIAWLLRAAPADNTVNPDPRGPQ
jgi:phosphatidylglycerophosphate synthase